MKQIIRTEHIEKSYEDSHSNKVGNEKRKVLDDVTLSIAEGEFVSIMGPSGSGKSTLLFAMSGMDNIDSGTVLFEDKNLTEFTQQELSDLRRTEMGFVFQQPTMLKNLNLLDNIILPAVSGNRKSIADMIKIAKKQMEIMGIGELCYRDITQVSGGQLQRAAVCRALLTCPKIIFGDEPTGALNSKVAEEIMNILDDIHKNGTAIMLVTHDVKVAARTQRILFMRDGKIVSELIFAKDGKNSTCERVNKITERMQEIGI